MPYRSSMSNGQKPRWQCLCFELPVGESQDRRPTARPTRGVSDHVKHCNRFHQYPTLTLPPNINIYCTRSAVQIPRLNVTAHQEEESDSSVSNGRMLSIGADAQQNRDH